MVIITDKHARIFLDLSSLLNIYINSA